MIINCYPETWLVRHGQSESNANLTTSEPQATKLTDKGWQQAKIFAQSLSRKPDLIIVSPFVRTLESAQPLLEKYPDTQMAEWPIEEFTYLSPSAYRGTTATQRRPSIEDYWQKNDPEFRHPGAESFTHFLARAAAVIERMKLLHGFTVIISHGHTIRLLWQILTTGLLSSPEKQMQVYNHLRQAVVIPNCSLLRLYRINDTEVLMSRFIDTTGTYPG